MLLSNRNNQLSQIGELSFSSEKELQILCEQNLEKLLNLEFIATEFLVSNFRIDTLAYDKEANAFIIIEYKNTKNYSVVDQGYSYLSAMLNNKAEFVLKLSEKRGRIYNKNDVNWEASKVIFISPLFTSYQTNSINFKDLPIELWKIKKYNNDTILFEQIKSQNATATINEIVPIKNSSNEIEVIKEIKNYNTENEQLNSTSNIIKDIYFELKEFILNENDTIETKNNKHYVVFSKNRKNLISIKIQINSIVIWINEKFENIKDEKQLIRDVTNIGHLGVGNCEIKIVDSSNIGYIQDIVKKFLDSKK